MDILLKKIFLVMALTSKLLTKSILHQDFFQSYYKIILIISNIRNALSSYSNTKTILREGIF